MKKLCWILSFLMILIFTGCDNNEGPFEIKKERGKSVVYSANKPAKGWIQDKIYNNDGTTTVVSEVYYDKGLPNGDFRLYDTAGNLVVNAKGKWNDSIFKGKIEETFQNGKGEGEFSINTDFLISYKGNGYYNFIRTVLITGKYEGDFYKCQVKNREMNGNFKEYYENGNIKIDVNYKEGKYDGICKEYYVNGNPKIDCIMKNGKLDGPYKEYSEDGTSLADYVY